MNEKFIEKLKKIEMKPKWHFILKTVLAVLAIFIISIVILFLFSFIMFSLRLNGFWFLFRFGTPGINAFFGFFPWFLIITSIILIIVLELLTKRFNFVWKRPIIYSLLIIIFLVLLFGFIVDRSNFHSKFFERAQENHLPIFGSFYKDNKMLKPSDIHRGIVLEKQDNQIKILTINREELVVTITDKTRLNQAIEIEDEVLVLGKRQGDVIEAVGIEKVNKEFGPKLVPQRKLMK
jgi:hypothetical protein